MPTQWSGRLLTPRASLAQVVPHLPRLWARLQQTRRAVRARRPHLVVGIDSKGFNLRLLGALARERAAAGRASGGGGGAPTPALVQYVAPSAWAFEDAEVRSFCAFGTRWLDKQTNNLQRVTSYL